MALEQDFYNSLQKISNTVSNGIGAISNAGTYGISAIKTYVDAIAADVENNPEAPLSILKGNLATLKTVLGNVYNTIVGSASTAWVEYYKILNLVYNELLFSAKLYAKDAAGVLTEILSVMIENLKDFIVGMVSGIEDTLTKRLDAAKVLADQTISLVVSGFEKSIRAIDSTLAPLILSVKAGIEDIVSAIPRTLVALLSDLLLEEVPPEE